MIGDEAYVLARKDLAEALAGAGILKGIGIEKTEIVDGRLIVTYDDGSTEDAGELPLNPNVVNVLDFGAVGDGTTEDTTAVKSAFEEAVESGKPLYIPEGEFLIDWGKISLDLGEKGLVVFGDGRTKSIIKLKDSQNGGNGGSGIALRNADGTIAPNVSISNIGMVYENNDDTALIYSGQARQINMLGYFGEVSVDNSYFHLGGTAETLPQDSCLFWSLGADTITITNCLFENFTNREVGGCVWIMPSDAENTYSIGQVIIKNNEFRNTNKDEAVAVYTSVADTENNVHNIVISGNVIAHKSWNSVQGNRFYTNGLISVLIANTSSPKNDGNVVISDNNLYSELASQEIIRITRFKGVEVRNNKLTVTAKNGSSNLRTIRFIQSDGVIKDNVLDYTAITENEVQADDGSNSKVSWESNRFILGTAGGINPQSNTTFVFKGNVVDIPNNKKFVIRKNQSTNTVEVYDNTINGNLSMGALNGSGLVIKGNRFNANVATTNSVDVSGGTGAYLDYQGNDGVVLQFKTGNVQTPISKFTYAGRKGQLKFLSGSTPLDDSSETRALFFSTTDIVYTDKQVEANPTLVGTEPTLDGIEIGENKLAVFNKLSQFGENRLYAPTASIKGTCTVTTNNDNSIELTTESSTASGLIREYPITMFGNHGITIHTNMARNSGDGGSKITFGLWFLKTGGSYHPEDYVMNVGYSHIHKSFYMDANTIAEKADNGVLRVILQANTPRDIHEDVFITLDTNEDVSRSTDLINLKGDVEKLKIGKDLYGKKVIFLGDSITAFTGNNSWVDRFCEITGVIKIVNTAVSGAKLADQEGTVYDGDPKYSDGTNNVLGNQVQKILNNNYETPDIIIIAIGTNDGITCDETRLGESYVVNNAIVPLADVDRTHSEGAFRYANETLHNRYPNAIICWCSPIHRALNSNRHYYDVYTWSQNLEKLTACGSAHFIDTMRCGILMSNEIYQAEGEYLADGTHPNSKGAIRMASFNADAISSAVKRSSTYVEE